MEYQVEGGKYVGEKRKVVRWMLRELREQKGDDVLPLVFVEMKV